MSFDDPLPLRNDIIDPLYAMLHNVISHYLKNHKDTTNEELDVVFSRLISFQRQQEMHLYSLYTWDLKKEEERLEKLKAEKPEFYR